MFIDKGYFSDDFFKINTINIVTKDENNYKNNESLYIYIYIYIYIFPCVMICGMKD